METMINAGLGLIMSDIPTFVNFASSGAFSGHESLSLPNVTAGLDFALKTYMTGESLLQNGWFGLIIGEWTEDKLNLNGGGCAKVSGGIICPETTDSSKWDQAAGLFWSNISGRQYMLSTNKNNRASLSILNAINANGWADLQTLFDGAYKCTFEGEISPEISVNAKPFLTVVNPSR